MEHSNRKRQEKMRTDILKQINMLDVVDNFPITRQELNILFINPSSMPSNEQKAFLDKSSILRVPSFSMPIGLMDLSAYLRKNTDDINITILDIGKDLFKIYENIESTPPMTLRDFIECELNTIDFEPDIIGISILLSTSHNSSILIADMARKKWNDAIITCGGNHATNYYHNLLKDSNIDYVVRGEGELSFTELVNKIQNREENINVFGIFDKNKLVKNHDYELSPMIDDINAIPTPAFDLLDIDYYKKTVGGSLMFSRGCSFKCTFCASHTVHGRKLRFKSAERIMMEFSQLIMEKFKTIIIEDDLFAVRKDIFLNIADKLSTQQNSIKFRLPQGLSVAVLDEEIIDAMVSMGIDEAAIAIESGSPYVQKHIIKKNVSLKKTRHILGYLREKDFLVYVNFILGFPGETKDLMHETIDFIKTIDVDWVYIFHALPLPGSEMCNQLVSKGIINLENFDWDGLRLGRRSFDTPEITAKELEKFVYETNIECNFIQNSNLKHGRYEKAVNIFNRFIIEPYPFHIVGRYCRALAYLGMNEHEKAISDFKECVKWVNINEESKHLFEKYKDKMPNLRQYFDQ